MISVNIQDVLNIQELNWRTGVSCDESFIKKTIELLRDGHHNDAAKALKECWQRHGDDTSRSELAIVLSLMIQNESLFEEIIELNEGEKEAENK